jgi:GxxExxY protein
MAEILFKDICYKINGLFFKIQNELGRYRNEKQYGDKFEQLLKENNIKYLREYKLPVSFIGEKNYRNIVDFIINDEIIIELKAKTIITKEDYFQTQRYLNTLNKKLCLLVNFRQKFLKIKRILNSKI